MNKTTSPTKAGEMAKTLPRTRDYSGGVCGHLVPKTMSKETLNWPPLAFHVVRLGGNAQTHQPRL